MRKSVIAALREDPNALDESKPRLVSGGFGILQFKPFKVPSSTLLTKTRSSANRANSTHSPLGKRKVTYVEDGYDFADLKDGDAFDPRAIKRQKKTKKDNEDSDDDGKKKKGFTDRYVAPPSPPKFPVYRPKAGVLVRSFTIPRMKKNGMMIENQFSGRALGTRKRLDLPPRPMHDPLEGNAIVVFDPTVDDHEAEQELARKAEQAKQQISSQDSERLKVHKSLAEILGISSQKTARVKVPVVIDPRLGKILRPHQVEGVQFLYRCTTGLVDENAFGCMMADEMGLGKTLQCISLLWTLLKQSPLPGKSTIDKAIVVCPASLVRNWANELVKWLGEGTIGVLAMDGKRPNSEVIPQLRQWCASSGRAVATPVLIVSYEKLRMLSDEIGQTEVGLMLADEGHKLKNADNQLYTALNKINCKRRVLLTGTPIQNNLTEYFTLFSFCNPGYLGSQADFRKKFEHAILKGRSGNATDKELELSGSAQKELLSVVNKFIIRRTNDLLTKYLPVKHEHIVFIKPSQFQRDLYKHFKTSPQMQALIATGSQEKEKGNKTRTLPTIQMLQKMCAHPDMIDFRSEFPGANKCFPEGYDPFDRRKDLDCALSGKMAVLDRFLQQMMTDTTDKIVIVSNYTNTLSYFEKMFVKRRYAWVRLDGTIPVLKRQKIVDKFNNPAGVERIFLLSSKAGGCGINLIGANRLILFDPDWNPAADMQALARVWRDGQKKTCFVYRFITTGTIEEKIFQRQSHKMNLSSCIVDSMEDVARHFTPEDLKQLFEYVEDRACQTHDLFKCKRCKNGVQVTKSPAMLYGEPSSWNHLSPECLKNVHDDLLRAEYGQDSISACFQFISSS